MWEIKKIFHRVDADQSGEIDKAEFEAAITADGALGQ
jgi:Ca2+-binding EF-hand superfamily protein